MKHTNVQPHHIKRLPTALSVIALSLATQLWSNSLLASDAEETTQPWDIGVTIGVVQSPFVGGKERLTLSPTRLKHGGLRLNGLAWPVYQQPEFNVYLGIGLDEWNYERDDSEQLADMNELDRAINARAGISTELFEGWLTAEIAKDLAGAHEGMQAKVRYTGSIGSETHEVRPYVEAQWLSAELTDYYVGVDSDEVAAGRPQYTADEDFAIKAGLGYRYSLTEAFTVSAGVNLTSYGSEVSNSPIVAEDMIWGANVGLTYRWK